MCMISYVISCHEQDCVVVLAPYPNNPNPVESFNITSADPPVHSCAQCAQSVLIASVHRFFSDFS